MYKLYNGDCLEIMPTLEAGSIDAIITDLPYGVSAEKWDSVIPIDVMFSQVERVLKVNGTFITTASQPFTSLLVCGALDMFKYELIWEKGRASGFVHAKNKPMKSHENILVFSKGTTVHANQSTNRMTYNPQMDVGTPYTREQKSINTGKLNHIPSKSNLEFVGKISENNGTRYPKSVLKFKNHNVGNNHPTQKPIELYEYLIRTYTNEGETVLDITMGSGTTIVAAELTNRNSIGIEKDPDIFKTAQDRILNMYNTPKKVKMPKPDNGLQTELV